MLRLEIWDPEDLSAAVDGVGAHDELINAVIGSAIGGRIATGSRDGRVSTLHSHLILVSFDLKCDPFFGIFSLILGHNMITFDTDTSVGQEKACTKCGKY